MNQIILNSPIIEAKNITFTAAEWAQYAAQVNADTVYFCYVFFCLGALAGAVGLYFGMMWYNGRQG